MKTFEPVTAIAADVYNGSMMQITQRGRPRNNEPRVETFTVHVFVPEKFRYNVRLFAARKGRGVTMTSVVMDALDAAMKDQVKFTTANLYETDMTGTVSLNMRFPAEFYQRMRVYAAKNEITMKALIIQATKRWMKEQ